jgi:hypothetical protein
MSFAERKGEAFAKRAFRLDRLLNRVTIGATFELNPRAPHWTTVTGIEPSRIGGQIVVSGIRRNKRVGLGWN